MQAGLDGPGRRHAAARTPDAILRRLLKEASETIPGLSPDPRQADPVVVMLLRSFAMEYADLYSDLDDTVGLAYRTLVERLIQFPRGPRPATTVLEVETKDPALVVPTAFEVLSERPVTDEQGRNHQVHFTPLEETGLSVFQPAAIAFIGVDGRGSCWTASIGKQRKGIEGEVRSFTAPHPSNPTLLVALEADEPHPEDPCTLFLYGPDAAVRAGLWGRWSLAGPQLIPIPLGSDLGPFLVPALRGDPVGEEEIQIFSFRTTSRTILSPYTRHFVPIGGETLLRVRSDAPGAGGEGLRSVVGPPRAIRSWIRIDLDPRITEGDLKGLRFSTRAVLALNREPRSTGAVELDNSPMQTYPFPEGVTEGNLLGIDEVIDLPTGHRYDPDLPDREPGLRSYRLTDTVERRHRRLALALRNDDPAARERRIEIRYSLSLGPVANSLAPGSIRVPFSPKDFPGIVSAENIVESIGGERAPSREEVDLALRSALRTRGRAISRLDYQDLARAFDPVRVLDVEIGRGVILGKRGPAPCVDVGVTVRARSFGSDLERHVFRDRLERSLTARSPVGVRVRVEVRES